MRQGIIYIIIPFSLEWRLLTGWQVWNACCFNCCKADVAVFPWHTGSTVPHKTEILGSYWDGTGILGSYWDYAGIILGFHWDFAGTDFVILGCYWAYAGHTGQCWDYTGQNFQNISYYWETTGHNAGFAGHKPKHLESILGLCWAVLLNKNTKLILGTHWAKHWVNTGHMISKHILVCTSLLDSHWLKSSGLSHLKIYRSCSLLTWRETIHSAMLWMWIFTTNEDILE